MNARMSEMVDIGLSNEQITMIVGVIEKAGASRAVVFGSRAKGGWRDNSDIDIAVFGCGVSIGCLHLQLDELPIPYKFDIISYTDIKNVLLREQIDRFGVEIYIRKM